MKKIAAVIFLTVLFFVIGFALWGRDEPLSGETAQLMQQPSVAEADNAYFSLLGFKAPAGKNPEELGRRMLTQFQVRQESEANPGEAQSKDSMLKQLAGGDELIFTENVLSTCDKEHVGQIACVVKNQEQIEKILSTNQVMFERYIALLHHSQFIDPAPALVLLRFTDLQRAKFALWAKAVLLIKDGQVTQGLDLLERDTRFWRMLSTQSNTLLARMVAVTMLRKQYELLSQIVAYFPSMAAAEKDKLLQLCIPFSERELSFDRAIAGEMHLTAEALARLDKAARQKENAGSANWSLDHPFWRKTPLYRHNATLNLQAKLLNQWAAFSRVSAPRLVKEKAAFTQGLESEYKAEEMPVYNRIGRQLVAAWFVDLGEYLLKAHDLDGLIRLVNLQIQIAAFNLPDERIGPFLQTSDAALTNPYTGEAMLWDSKERTLSFKAQGREDGGEVAVALNNPLAQQIAKEQVTKEKVAKGSVTHSF